MHSAPSISSTLLGALLITVLTNSVAAVPDSHRFQCRCQPSQPCWPNNQAWSAFAETVGGRLIATVPPAYQCHDPHYDSDKCKEIQEGYFFDHWRQFQPGAVQQTNWELVGDKGCLGFNRTMPCHQGAVPLYTVKATTIEDVQNTVRFAAKHNIRLVVKNTGHDYFGRSIGASSLNLWVYFMEKIAFDDDFIPEGAPSGTAGNTAIILDSGVLWKDAYKAADEHNVVVVGGADATVGTSGGFCQGGGHGPLSPRHGLCVDNVLQYKVVTADGELKIANAFQNKDLFWALRGGGGATFGVVVEAVYKTHPPPKAVSFAAYRLLFDATKTRQQVLSSFLSHQPQWSDAGWSGYAFIQSTFMSIFYFQPDSDLHTANASFTPFLKSLESIGNVQINGTIRNAPSFWESFQAWMPPPNSPNAGTPVALGSRLIPRRNFESMKDVGELTEGFVRVQDALQSYSNPYAGMITHLVAGGQVSKGNRAETSVNPAWRNALIHVVATTQWALDTPETVRKSIARKLTAAIQHLRDLSPGSGAYFNEADPNEPDWQHSFFGVNYPRLNSIKHKVDPSGVFTCHKCVGSEEWSKDMMCRRR